MYGTAEGVRADPQIGRRLDSEQIDETPILGRKVTTLPLLNSAFRQAKGTGDLFVNATYFVTGAGGRRQTTVTLDGANNDEAWGRQTMITTVPIGAIQEMALLSNAFSAEFGWTAGAGPQHRDQVRHQRRARRGAVHDAARELAGGPLFDERLLRAVGRRPAPRRPRSRSISPVDIPDELNQVSGSVGGPIVKDRTFFFATADYTRQDRTTALSPSLPAFVLPADGSLAYTGRYRQKLVNARVDHKLNAAADADGARATSTTSTTPIRRTRSAARMPPPWPGPTTGRTWTAQVNHTAVLGASLFNEARFAYLNGDPVTRWESGNLSTTYSRSGSVPFTIGQSRLADMFGHQAQFSDTLSWSRGRHYVRFGGSLTRHTSGGQGSEFGSAVLGTFTFRNTTTAPFEELTLADVQQYSQPISYGITTYELTQWMTAAFVQDSIRAGNGLTLDLGLRYDRQSLTDATKNFAPRVGFGWHPNGDARLVVRGGYGMYYTQIRSNLIGNALVGGLDGLTSYTATPGQLGFPTCLTGSCLPLSFDPNTLPASQLPARDITIRAGQRDFYRTQFASYGLDFDLLPNYPDAVRESAQPGAVDRRRARAGTRAVHRRRLRAPALDQPRRDGRSERAGAVRPDGPGTDAQRGGRRCDASDPARERRRPAGQRADEHRRGGLRRAADATELSRSSDASRRRSAIRCRRPPTPRNPMATAWGPTRRTSPGSVRRSVGPACWISVTAP